MSIKKILLVGGGTGGHFYPLIAIAEKLRALGPEYQLYYAGPDAYDKDSLDALNINLLKIPAGKRRRYSSLRNFLDIFVTGYGFFVALIKLYILYPDVIVSKGGYTSVPVVIAAIFFRIPVILHDSDSRVGTANKLVLRFAKHVVVSYDEAYAEVIAKNSSVHNLGIPVRSTLLQPPTGDAIESLGIDPNRPLILVLGGSQGAERINQLIFDSLDNLLPQYTIMHQTGKANYNQAVIASETLVPDPELRKYYIPVAFLDAVQMNNAYHLSQIVISRAGSTSIYEIAIHGKPSIIIPIPESISHDQRTNAYAYARAGAAVVIEEENMSDSLLQAEIDRIMQNTALYEQMSQSARAFGKTDVADRMRGLITEITEQH
jgi:UDP-N-acetylglucosamine--N-acetylmuramyl-(pentapeptide) pyrophosphoryl-undecaprenol N-acetylglucosamine transferase